jgi:hypothetical protein
MVPRRQPIQRKRRVAEFTPEAIEAFSRLLKVIAKKPGCCGVFDFTNWAAAWKDHREGKRDWPPYHPRCAACQAYDERYTKAFNEVLDVLHLGLSEDLLDPDPERIPFPPGSSAHEKYWANPMYREARDRWHRLERACRVDA